MSMLKVKSSGRRPVGRPIGTVLKKPEKKGKIPIRISEELYELIAPELRKSETYSDTILRIIRESRRKHITEAKKVRALVETLSSVPDADRYIRLANDLALSYIEDSR